MLRDTPWRGAHAPPATEHATFRGQVLLVIVERGVTVARGRDRELSARAGDALVLVDGGSLQLSADAEVTRLGIPEVAARRLRGALGGSLVLSAERIAEEPRLAAIARLLRAATEPSRATACLAEAFVWCACELSAAGAEPDAAIRRAIALVESAIDRRRSVESLARAVGLSRAAFTRRFREATGESPDRYFTALRLEQAAERLLSGDASLAEIARDVGYASEFAFSRAFKRRYGVAPGIYRKQWNGLARSLAEPVARAA